MSLFRTITAGFFIWGCVFIAFAFLNIIPLIKDSQVAQSIIMAILTVPFAYLAAVFFYKGSGKANGLKVGALMALTALVLDALITVPLVEIPNGRSFYDFFTHPLLWGLVALNITTVFSYWWLNQRKKN